MASLRSLGVHTPSALSYLIAEQILPEDASEDHYTWETPSDNGEDSNEREEILYTDDCVVYSKGTIIQKVFKFEAEEQKVQQALLTRFYEHEIRGYSEDAKEEEFSRGHLALPPSGRLPLEGGFGSSHHGHAYDIRSHTGQRRLSRALVVILKFQAHVFFITGPSHVINLPFEVERAFTAHHGIVLQRRVPNNDPAAPTPMLPPAPNNSFISSQSSHVHWSQTKHLQHHHQSPPSTRKGEPLATNFHEELLRLAEPNVPDTLPWLYSCTDPLSEMGLIVVAPSSSNQYLSVHQELRENFEPLDKAEEILYLSRTSEVPDEPKELPFLLVVTGNYSTKRYSLYQAVYVEEATASIQLKHAELGRMSNISQRRSSYNPVTGTGATTPSIRNLRESYGGPIRPKMASASHNAADNQKGDDNVVQTAEDALASQVDPDFGLPRGANRESRRVSSLLSRTDLNSSFDRSAFQDLATGTSHSHANPNLASFSRRGPSLGGYSNRASFGGSSHIKTRMSSPGSVSRISIGMESVDETLEDITIQGDSDDEDDLAFALGTQPANGLGLAVGGLRKELVLTKFDDVPMHVNADKAPRDSLGRSSEKKKLTSQDIRIFTATSRKGDSETRWAGKCFTIHFYEKTNHHYLELEYSLKQGEGASSKQMHKSGKPRAPRLSPFRINMRRASGYVDGLKVIDRASSDLVVIRNEGDKTEISMYNGETPTMSPTLTFKSLKLFNSFMLGTNPTAARRGAGLNRILDPPKSLFCVENAGVAGEFDVLDSEGLRHRVQVQLQARDNFVARALGVCEFVLSSAAWENFKILWRIILSGRQDDDTDKKERIALITTLFSLAIPLLDSEQKQTTPSDPLEPITLRQSKPQSLKSDSIKNNSLHPWESMWDCQKRGADWKSWSGRSWDWLDNQEEQYNSTASNGLLISAPNYQYSIRTPSATKSNAILRCISIARRARKSNQVKCLVGYIIGMKGQNGVNLVKLVIALHLLREEQKLSVIDQEAIGWGRDLGPVLAQISGWLGWNSWSWRSGGFYDLEKSGENHYNFEQNTIAKTAKLAQPWPYPPSIIEWIGTSIDAVNIKSFPTLMVFVSDRQEFLSNAQYGNSCRSEVAKLTPRTVALTEYIYQTKKAAYGPVQDVEAMARHKISNSMMETFPEIVLINLQQSIVKCQSNPPTTWNRNLLKLISREDMIMDTHAAKDSGQDASSPIIGSHHIAVHDVRTICQSTEYPKISGPVDSDKSAITRLIFSEDQRFVEAARLLQPLRPTVAECPPDPNWSEAEYLDAQKEVMQWVMVRTFSLPVGQAMINVDKKKPLLTEKFPLHGFTTICLMKPMNNTVSADRSSFTEEKYCWAFFHAGVSAGLSISRDAKGIDTSWIVFNKPTELSNKHAGLLLALGLNGYLKSIAKWLAFKYLTPKHTMTSIGLLLGLSASYFGTMDTLITRLLSVHVTRMLPPGAAELNLSPLTQTTGLMGIGLLYANSQHRRMSEVMLAELEDVTIEDPSGTPDQLRDEGYRLAAGFALGYINLAKGDDLRGLHDMRLIERLLAVAVGPRPVDLVHILDQATAGATVAIALIFMKTENEAIARKVDVPDTLHQFDYVRPDIFLLRTLAKNLIMWKGIRPNDAWILNNIPHEFRKFYHLRSIKKLRSFLMPFYNILTGLLWSVALKYAGTGDRDVRDFLLKYMDQFIRLSSLSAVRYDTRLTRNTVRNCQDLIGLSVATVMAGTGDLNVFRRLRYLHGRIYSDTPYGSHMAAHMALGALFLGGGTYTFGSTPLAIASLMCAFYPIFPTDVLDNKAHLQAFRHFWVLAASPRCLVVRDVETRRAISSPVVITLTARTNNGKTQILERTAPCLLPPLDTISSLRTASPDHWPVTLDFTSNPTHASSFQYTHTIVARRRPARAAYQSAFAAALAAKADRDLRATGAAAAATAATIATTNPGTATHSSLSSLGTNIPSMNSSGSWDWLARLPSFAGLDAADWALVLPPSITNSSFSSIHSSTTNNNINSNNSPTITTMTTDMSPSVVDYRLSLTRTAAKSWDRNELLWLRLLFRWTERALERGEDVKWIGAEVVLGWMATVKERAGAL